MPNGVKTAPPPPAPPDAAVVTGSVKAWFMLSSSTQARLYDMPMSRAAADIDPVLRMLSSSFTLPGPIRAPDSKTMLILTRAIALLSHTHDGCTRSGAAQ